MRSLSNWSLMYRVLRANFDGMSSSACPRPPDPLPGDVRVEYRVGYKATDLALMEDRVRLSFVDNVNQKYGSIEADMVIGADGLHSTVRRLVGASTPEQYSGYITWRGTVPEAQVTHATVNYFRDTVGLNFTPRSYAVV
jgi:2-polyprenyl-6-methoxyphenol hydroxylase-like FAD-dependent oxidoreductase